MTVTDNAVEVLGAKYCQDPYSVHARLRLERPVAAVSVPGEEGTRLAGEGWLITRHADARAALNDPRLHKLRPDSRPDPAMAIVDSHLLNSDPPDHVRLRKLVNKAFTPRRVEGLRPRIASITNELLDAMSTHDEVDLLASFAFPLPLTVICDLLGVPVADREAFHGWFATIVSNTASPDKAMEDGIAMVCYFQTLLAAKRSHPVDDMLSALISARDEGESLSENELVSMAFLLMIAGHETTANLIGNGMLALLLNPAELARLRADPGLIGGGVDELLRFANPVTNATYRYATEPLEIGGMPIGRGDLVIVSLAGANRDPCQFADPDRLDLGRDSSAQLGFGHGSHYCLGTPLARLQMELAFGGLLERFGSMRLAVPVDELRWRPSTFIHGLEELPVRLHPDGGNPQRPAGSPT